MGASHSKKRKSNSHKTKSKTVGTSKSRSGIDNTQQHNYHVDAITDDATRYDAAAPGPVPHFPYFQAAVADYENIVGAAQRSEYANALVATFLAPDAPMPMYHHVHTDTLLSIMQQLHAAPNLLFRTVCMELQQVQDSCVNRYPDTFANPHANLPSLEHSHDSSAQSSMSADPASTRSTDGTCDSMQHTHTLEYANSHASNAPPIDLDEKALVKRRMPIPAARKKDALRIGVVGSVNTGKSTLLNVLIGATLSPTLQTNLTAVPTIFRHDFARHVHSTKSVQEIAMPQQSDSEPARHRLLLNAKFWRGARDSFLSWFDGHLSPRLCDCSSNSIANNKVHSSTCSGRRTALVDRAMRRHFRKIGLSFDSVHASATGRRQGRIGQLKHKKIGTQTATLGRKGLHALRARPALPFPSVGSPSGVHRSGGVDTASRGRSGSMSRLGVSAESKNRMSLSSTDTIGIMMDRANIPSMLQGFYSDKSDANSANATVRNDPNTDDAKYGASSIAGTHLDMLPRLRHHEFVDELCSSESGLLEHTLMLQLLSRLLAYSMHDRHALACIYKTDSMWPVIYTHFDMCDPPNVPEAGQHIMRQLHGSNSGIVALELIDTPGVGESTSMSDVLQFALKCSDVTINMVSPDAALTERQKSLFNLVATSVHPLSSVIVVMGKSDLVSSSNRGRKQQLLWKSVLTCFENFELLPVSGRLYRSSQQLQQWLDNGTFDANLDGIKYQLQLIIAKCRRVGDVSGQAINNALQRHFSSLPKSNDDAISHTQRPPSAAFSALLCWMTEQFNAAVACGTVTVSTASSNPSASDSATVNQGSKSDISSSDSDSDSESHDAAGIREAVDSPWVSGKEQLRRHILHHRQASNVEQLFRVLWAQLVAVHGGTHVSKPN
jgi:GTPase SAR1 family protein